MGLFGGSGHYIIYRMITFSPESDGATDRETDLPHYRCYGVKRRKYRILESAAFAVLSGIALWIYGICALAAGMFLMSILMYGEVLSRTLVLALGLGLLIWFRTRRLRKRMKLMRRLRRLCTKQGYRMTRNKPWYLSFVWTGEQPDLVLQTDTDCYYVHFLTVKRYRSALFLEKANTLRLVTYPLNNIFTVIFGRKPKSRYYPLCPCEEELAPDGLCCRRVVVLNPTCREMYAKEADGTRASTGSGAEFCGYTLYTGSAFLEAVKRRDGEN